MAPQMQIRENSRQLAKTFGCSPDRLFRISRHLSRPSLRAQRSSVRPVASQKASGGDFQRDLERFLQRYDITSASVGALTVTSYCVWRGQDPLTALSITLAATVAALVGHLLSVVGGHSGLQGQPQISLTTSVINEYIFESRQ